jgi:hypothetical protein
MSKRATDLPIETLQGRRAGCDAASTVRFAGAVVGMAVFTAEGQRQRPGNARGEHPSKPMPNEA